MNTGGGILQSKNNIAIIGAGLAGSLLAIYLAKKGFKVDVYERRPDMRKHEIGGGRSINLALSTRGIYALKEVGLYEEIKKIAIPMYGRMIHPVVGDLYFQRYGKDDSEYINAVSRGELNKALMNLSEGYDGVNIHFNQRCTGIDFDSGEILLHDEVRDTPYRVKPETTIATDGAASPVRQSMLHLPRFNFSQEYENYGYKELIIPPGTNGSFLIEKNALHIWPRGAYMLIALPNLDGSFTCTLFLGYDYSLGKENSFEFLQARDKTLQFFNSKFHDAADLMPELLDDFFGNPTGSLITVKCYPWAVDDKAVLLGDSAHAIVPFFGQGMNAAFEDCTYLNECIGKYGNDWATVFDEFQKIRKANSDAIADLAQENFIEMRDLVAEPRFQLKKKIEAELAKKYPGRFIPKYSMVTFNRFPYDTAMKRGKIQESILQDLSEGIDSLENVDWEFADKLIQKRLEKIEII
jgi:kynurenine 3-monooxygenase